MARAAGGAREHVERLLLDPLPRPEEQGAVEVALDASRPGRSCSHAPSSGIRQSTPITFPPAAAIGPSSVTVFTRVQKRIAGQSTAAKMRAEYGCTNSS